MNLRWLQPTTDGYFMTLQMEVICKDGTSTWVDVPTVKTERSDLIERLNAEIIREDYSAVLRRLLLDSRDEIHRLTKK